MHVGGFSLSQFNVNERPIREEHSTGALGGSEGGDDGGGEGGGDGGGDGGGGDGGGGNGGLLGGGDGGGGDGGGGDGGGGLGGGDEGGDGGGGLGGADGVSGGTNRPLKSVTLRGVSIVELNPNWMRSSGCNKYVLNSSSKRRVAKTLAPKLPPTTSRVTSPSRVLPTS